MMTMTLRAPDAREAFLNRYALSPLHPNTLPLSAASRALLPTSSSSPSPATLTPATPASEGARTSTGVVGAFYIPQRNSLQWVASPGKALTTPCLHLKTLNPEP